MVTVLVPNYDNVAEIEEELDEVVERKGLGRHFDTQELRNA